MKLKAPLASVLLMLALASCPDTIDPWEPIYRDASHNYLLDGGNAYGFDNFEPTAADAPGWRRAYGEDAGSVHLLFEPTGTSTVAGDGPPAGSAVYRLRTNNLLPQGDLEGETVGTDPSFFTRWPAIDFSGSNLVQEGQLNNRYLQVSVDAKSFIYLSTAPINGSYLLLATTNRNSINIRDEDPTDISLNRETIASNIIGTNSHLTGGLFELVHSFSTDDEYRPMIGSSTSETDAQFDDFRIVSADLKLGLALELANDDTYPRLYQGWFRFSVWIKKYEEARYPWEPTPDSATAQRPLASRAVAIGIGKSASDMSYKSIDLPSPEAWDTWTLVWVDKQMRFEQSEEGAVLRLELWPVSPDARDAASILVASPSLSFHLEGL